MQDLIDTGLLDANDTSATIRWYYSLNMGADMGLSYSSWLPTEDPIGGYYDWNYTQYVAPGFDMANKDELIEVMANNPSDPAYTDALTVLNDVDATDDDVADALDLF